MKTYRLAVLRHGLTRANLEGRYAGAGTDWPLCEAGREQLRQMAAQFSYPPAQAVFVSPLLRCDETAEILYPGVRRFVIQDLREAHFGEFEGRSAEELAGDAAYRRWLDPKEAYTPVGGEDGAAFAARTGDLLMKLFEFMMKSDITDAAAITHNGVAMSMLAARALPQRPAADWACDAGAGYLVQCDPQLWMRDGLCEAMAIVPDGWAEATGAVTPAQEDEEAL